MKKLYFVTGLQQINQNCTSWRLLKTGVTSQSRPRFGLYQYLFSVPVRLIARRLTALVGSSYFCEQILPDEDNYIKILKHSEDKHLKEFVPFLMPQYLWTFVQAVIASYAVSFINFAIWSLKKELFNYGKLWNWIHKFLINKKFVLFRLMSLCYFTFHLNLHCPNINKFCTTVEWERFPVFRVDQWVQKAGQMWLQRSKSEHNTGLSKKMDGI